MKRIITFVLVISALLCTCGFVKAEEGNKPLRTNRQNELHDIANRARALGLPESNPIIQEAKRLWHQEEEDLRIIANVILHEAPHCSDRHQQLVAQVILNRVASPLAYFPDTVKDVVNAPGQYDPAYTRNLPERGDQNPEVQRAFRNALDAINGEVDCPDNVVYQSEFDYLGSGNYEIHEARTDWFWSLTYFNYE